MLIQEMIKKTKFYQGSDEAILTDVSDGLCSDEDEEPFVKPDLPGVEEKPAKSEDRVMSYIRNLRGKCLL